MKISLFNFFSVMAASSFVSSANAQFISSVGGNEYNIATNAPTQAPPITLADYAASSIDQLTENDPCFIKVVTASGANLTCNLLYDTTSENSMTGSTIVADLYSGECGAADGDATVGQAAVAVDHADRKIGLGVVATTIAMDAFDATNGGNDKNTGTIVQKYCARADVWDNDVENQASGSVLAYMMTVTTNVTFDQEGDFTVDVTTTEFDAEAAAASADREVLVHAVFGECPTSTTSTALKDQDQDGSTIAIGAVLAFCIFSDYSVDTDVAISKIKNVAIKDKSNANNVLTSPIDDNGGPNFVTTIGEYGKAVDIKTLMIPKIYDDNTDADGKFTITGTAQYVYSRRLSSGERRLQSEDAPFSLEVELTKNDLPQVAMNEEESGAMSAGAGMMALAAGVAVLL